MKNKPIVLFDTETTGLSKQFDWIIQLSAVKFDRNTFKEIGRFNSYIKPAGKYEIDPKAAEVHGLTKEFIEKEGRPLKQAGPEFLDFITDCDIMGYNSNGFDVLMAYKDFSHSGLNFPIEGVQFYDVLAMERRIHPMNLGSVFERYKGITMEQAGLKAHDSMSDVLATLEVFKSQMELLDWDTIDEWEENSLFVPDGTVRKVNLNDVETVVFNQGKYKDRDVYEVMKEDAGYLKWCAKNMFSPYTLKVLRKYCNDRQNFEKNSAKS